MNHKIIVTESEFNWLIAGYKMISFLMHSKVHYSFKTINQKITVIEGNFNY